MYVAEVLSCCNISTRRKRAHVEAVPTYMCIIRNEAGISKHEVHNCMRRRTSMRGVVCRRNSCIRGQMCRHNSCMWGADVHAEWA